MQMKTTLKGKSADSDKFNKSNRTRKNTNYRIFNCAGYALDMYNFFQPFESGYDFDCHHKLTNLIEGTKYIVENVPNTRVIRETKDAEKDEIVIAFRTGEYDFHFMKRGLNHQWYQKMGARQAINKVDKKDVFAEKWISDSIFPNIYNSPLVLIAKKVS